MVDKIAATKREENKQRVISAYENRQTKENGFYAEVMKFAKLKLYGLEVEFLHVGTANTVDDYVQDVCVRVLEGLPKFEREREERRKEGQSDGEAFYAWLHRICYTQAAEFFNELKHQRDNKAPLTTEVSDSDSGESLYELDNDELYSEPEGLDGYIRIPEWITGDDRYICKLIMDGKTAAEIGEYLGGISEAAVWKRMQRIRDRSKKIRETQKEEPTRRGRVRVG